VINDKGRARKAHRTRKNLTHCFVMDSVPRLRIALLMLLAKASNVAVVFF
jgi:hypothetical protein